MNTNLKSVQDKSGQLWEQMRDLANRAKTESRELSADENQQLDIMLAEHGKLEKDIARLAQLEEILANKAEAEAEKQSPSKDKKDESEEYKRVFWKFQQVGARGMNNSEIDMIAKAQTTVTDSAGGYTVPQGFSNELFVEMAQWGAMLDIARIVRTSTGNQIDWPTLDDTGQTGALLTETTQIGEQDMTFGSKTLDAYTYTSKLVRVQRQLLQDSYFNLESELRMAFARRLGTAMNANFTTGTGSSQPNGYVTAGTVGKTSAANTTVTGAELIDLIHSVDRVYRNNARFVMNDASLAIIKKLTIGSSGADNRPLWTQSLVSGEESTILGFPYTINPDMASFGAGAKPIAFGDFSYYIIRLAGDPIVQRLEERYADYLQVGFLAFQRADGELLSTNALKILRNPTT